MRSLVIDVSVLVAAVSPSESSHDEASQFLNEVHKRKPSLREPAHFLLELYAVLSRNPRQLQQLGFLTLHDPLEIEFHGIGAGEVQRLLAWLAANAQGRVSTRGADLAYLIVALENRCRLVTLDKGLLEYQKYGADVCSPRKALEDWHDEAAA
jgi:predicted nucleic acid-binding protein